MLRQSQIIMDEAAEATSLPIHHDLLHRSSFVILDTITSDIPNALDEHVIRMKDATALPT